MRLFSLRHLALIGLLTALCLMTCACDASPQPLSGISPSPSQTATVDHVRLFPLSPGVPAPNRLVVGPDGTLWMTASDWATGQAAMVGATVHDAIVRMTPAGAFTVFSLPQPASAPYGLATGPDGNLWFAEFYANAIGRLTPQGAFVEYPVPPRSREPGAQPQSQPHSIVQGPDGNLWFLDLGGNKVARLTTTGMLTEFPLPPHSENPSGSSPESIAAGPDGALWFTEGTSNRIGRITVDGRVTEFKLPGADHIASDIVASADGALWFLEPSQELFGRITTQGHITEFSWPCAVRSTAGIPATPSNTPCEVMNIANGPDGAMWFSEKWRNALGRIDGQGHVVEYGLPALSIIGDGPEALALGPDGELWFTYCAYTTCAGVGRFSV